MQYIAKSILLLIISLCLVCVIYPLILWGIAQSCFPFQANGSIVEEKGSLLIAQAFTQGHYFQPRPSACSYDARASASSSLAASNPALQERVAKTVGNEKEVPGDFVTTSASGLDPHITLDNAHFQLDRVASHLAALVHRPEAEIRKEVEQLLKEHAFQPLGGLAGVPLINVLEVNLALKITG